MNIYIENKKVINTLRSCKTPDQFRVAKKMTISHTDDIIKVIVSVEDKLFKKSDDIIYIEQLKLLRENTLRELRERAMDFEVE